VKRRRIAVNALQLSRLLARFVAALGHWRAMLLSFSLRLLFLLCFWLLINSVSVSGMG
jgi:hypothetical protein